MNQEYLLQMLRATIPRDNNLLETFLRYQSEHFDEPWENLLLNFMTQKDKRQSPVQVVIFETEVSAFVQASTSEEVSDLITYTQTFGQAGLKKLTQLTDKEKALVIEVALFNLATRFQLLDQEGAYQSISVASLLDKGNAANLVNVYRVANNLSDRISRDIEQFLLTYDPEIISTQDHVEEKEGSIEEIVIPEPYQDIAFREEEGVIIANLEEELSQLDLRTGQTKHLPAYQNLNLAQKFEILNHFDQVRNSRPKLPNLRRGEFDHEMEMTPIYENDELLTYLESDGTVYDQNFDTVYFNEELAHDFASWVSGDSMEPKYQNGSVALIRETGFDYDGAVYAVVCNNQTYIKRVYREEDGLRLVSINPKYKDIFISYEEDPRIVGIIVGNFVPMEG